MRADLPCWGATHDLGGWN